MTKLALIVSLVLPACGGATAPQTPAPSTATPTPAAPAAGPDVASDLSHLELGEISLIETSSGRAAQLHTDGSLVIPEHETLVITPDGKLLIKATGEEIMRILPDGSLHANAGTVPSTIIAADGSATNKGQLYAFDTEGYIGGDRSPGAFRVEGATTPALKRTAWFMFAGLLLYSQLQSTK